jgi:hypothetical protein
MGNYEEKVLSQSDIDSLVASLPEKPRAAATTSSPVTPEKPAQPKASAPVPASQPAVESPPTQTISSSELADLQNTVADLAKQIGKLADTKQKLTSLENRVEQFTKLIKQQIEDIDTKEQRINEISIRMQEVFQNQKSKYELQDYFQCDSCKSKGTVAFMVKCTHCDKEQWLGWWPEEK